MRPPLEFVPLVFDSFGAASPTTLAFIHQVANFYASHNMCTVQYASKLIHQKLSAAIQRSTGKMLTTRDRLCVV